MKFGEFVERADEILLARQLNEYMGVEDESPRRLSADERVRQYGDIEDDEERQLAEQFDRYLGVEHEPQRSFDTRDYSDLDSGEEVTLAMELDRLYGKPEVTR